MKLHDLNSEDLRILSFNNTNVGKVIASILESARESALKGEYNLSLEDLPIDYNEVAIVKNELTSKGFVVELSEEIKNNCFIRKFYVSWE